MSNRGIGALLAALLPGILAPSVYGQAAGTLVSAQGTVEVAQPDWAPARVNQELQAGAQVRTGQRSRAAILLADETQIKLGPSSQMELRAARPSGGLLGRLSRVATGTDQSILNVGQGKAWMKSKRTPARVQVNTPAVTAAVRGTEFVLEVAADGETLLAVVDGAIDYSNDQGSIQVNAGELGRARVGEAPTKTILVNPDDAVQWSLYYSAAVSARDYPLGSAAAGAAEPVVQAGNLYDAGRLEEALEAARGVASPQAALVRGWVQLASNRLGEALQELQQAGDSPRARLGRSLAHQRLGELGPAYDLVADAPESPLRLQRASILLQSGEVQEAQEALAPIAGRDPYFAQAQSLRATIRLVLNDKDEALALAREAVEAAPQSPTPLLALSRVQQSFFQLEEATRSARRALELDPGFVQARVQYAKLLFGAGRTGEAEELARDAQARAPGEAEVHSLLGFVQLARAKTEDAVAAFQRAVELDSALAEPHLGLGIAYLRQGLYVEAVGEIFSAALLDPRISLYQSYLAKGFYELREFEQALGALQEAMELDPRDPTPHLYAGIFQNDLNRPALAVQHFQQSIRLNDNRAVYRSRTVLDQDQATRNVQLAAAYNRLGLSEWANLEAVKSTLADATNSSAHLFLANTFLNVRGRTGAAGSESLVARLLLPVNANSFNAFNDYTTLYERPRINVSTEGSYGSFDAARSTAVLSGGTGRFAFGSAFTFGRTAGFRPVNGDSTSYTTANVFKFALDPSSDLLVTYSHDQARFGDISRGVVTDQDDNNEDRRFFTRLHRGEVGYHRRLRPGSEVMVYFAGRFFELVDDDALAIPGVNLFGFCRAFGRPFPPCAFQDLRQSLKAPGFTLQAAHYLKLEDLQFKYGFDFFEGRSRNRETQHYVPSLFDPFFMPGDPDEPVEQTPFTERRTVRNRTAFLQTDWEAHPRLTLTGGFTYDWANDDNAFIEGPEGEDGTTSQFNPQGGVLFTPWDSAVIRFAASRTLQPLVSGLGQAFVRERLVPTHLNGFVFNLNEPELSRSNVYEAGWDQRLGGRSFVRASAFLRDRRIPAARFVGNREEELLFDGHWYGGSGVWNYFFDRGLAFSAGYSLSHAEDLAAIRRDHEVTAGVFFVDSSGFSASLRENYRRQDGATFGRRGLGGRRTDTQTKIFTTDATVSYELPRKFGLISFEATNLFDRRFSILVDPLALDQRIPRRRLEVTLRLIF